MSIQTRKFIFLGICAVLTLAIPIVFIPNTFLVVVLMAVLSCVMYQINPRKSYIFVYVVGFVFGTISEIIAIHYGLWSYRDALIFGIPVYLPFAWGNAGLYILGFHDFIK